MIPKNYNLLLVVLILIQSTESQNNSTFYRTNSSIPEAYSTIFRMYNNASRSTDLFISKEGFDRLIRDLQLKQRSTKSKTFKNHTVKCHNSSQMLSWYSEHQKGLSKSEFLNVCPTLLIQIASRVCRPQKPMKKIPENLGSSNYQQKNVWLYSFGAVAVCSLVGLLVVWLIPFMPKSYYNSMSQLLIALAVGSLAGDALLHLIPHALLDNGKSGHSHGSGENAHSKMVWKSLVALVGIHLFFLTERITILCQNFQSKRKLKIKQISKDNFYSEISAGDKFDDSEKIQIKTPENKALSTGKLHWASKSRKYSGSSRELEHASSHMGIDAELNFGAHLCNRPKSKPHVNSDCPDSMNFDLCNTTNPYSMNRESNGSNVNNCEMKLQTNGEIKSSNISHTCEEKNNLLVNEQKERSNWSNTEEQKLLSPQSPTEGNTMFSEVKIVNSNHHHEEDKGEIGAGGATVKSSLAHPYKNKPHGHHHGHSHDLSSVKAIAYTVIAGDGLHNFCDGIAIGAAFASDIRGGFSTAIAVLCHELPHELGDFVVLLHAGMSLRTAIFYNLISSIFCCVGMIIGVQLGKVPSISSWIFMLTAGMFLYIALVDMMPELSTRRLKGKKIFHRPSILFLWQNIGFIIGSAIMLVIALYEENMF